MLRDVNFPRRLRIRLIGMLSIVLLFSQLAVAAYACPAMNGPAGNDAASMAGMPCAEMMAAGVDIDPEQPLLCMQHCQFGSTTHVVDQTLVAFASVTALPALFTVSLDVSCEAGPACGAERERLRDWPPPIAHSIAHCCFRI
jgi:hypothetical protein